MYVIDTNALVILILGSIDTKHFGRHKRVEEVFESDFTDLLSFVGSYSNLIVLPNVWTELDNLLNSFSGNQRYQYVQQVVDSIKESTETYISSDVAVDTDEFFPLGLTDALLLIASKDHEGLITSDSGLSDYAKANGIFVYDVVKIRTDRLRSY